MKERIQLSLAHGGTGIPRENEEYPIEFFRIKPQIRKRDNYTCQECGTQLNKKSRLLHVHHVDYDKKNNTEENLICLCHKCNIQANYNRKYWKKHFQRRIKCV